MHSELSAKDKALLKELIKLCSKIVKEVNNFPNRKELTCVALDLQINLHGRCLAITCGVFAVENKCGFRLHPTAASERLRPLTELRNIIPSSYLKTIWSERIS